MPSPSSQSSTEALYRDHHSWLRAWLRGRLGCSQQAADLAQDTFLRLIASRRPLASIGDKPRALLTHIAKGLVIDHWRRRDLERAYFDALAQLPEAEAPSPETTHLILETLTQIEAMLWSMPGRTRDIFLLAQLDGLTLEQIATETKTPIITVRRHISKALLACMTLV